jgi:hypothetical protein
MDLYNKVIKNLNDAGDLLNDYQKGLIAENCKTVEWIVKCKEKEIKKLEMDFLNDIIYKVGYSGVGDVPMQKLPYYYNMIAYIRARG